MIAGLCLAGALAGALWLAARARFRAIVPAIGLTLAFLVLAGAALAAVHALSTVPAALAIGAVTVAAAWASVWYPAPGRAEWQARLPRPGPLARRRRPGLRDHRCPGRSLCRGQRHG